MSAGLDDERTILAADSKMMRAKKRISECMEVNSLTYEGLTVTAIAQRLAMTRHKVRVIQVWLGWRLTDQRWSLGARSASRHRDSSWGMRYPESEAG